MTPGGRPLAEFGERLAAYLVDSVVFTIAILIPAVPVSIWFWIDVWMPAMLDAEASAEAPWREIGLLLLIDVCFVGLALVAAYVYYVELMFRSGQTLGKRVLKLRVLPLDPAATLSRKMAAKRYLVGYVAAAFIPFFSYLDGLWQLWDKPYRQCLHDKWAQTVVVKLP